MKKIIFASAITLLSTIAFAQDKHSGKKNKDNHEYKTERHDDNDDNEGEDNEYKKEKKDKNHEYEGNDRSGRTDENGNKFSKNIPAKVRESFNRDFPNVNASWTKGNGIWTARFNTGGIVGRNKTVSYRANGQRVGKTGIFN